MSRPPLHFFLSLTLSLLLLAYIVADHSFRSSAFSASNAFAASAQEHLGTGFFRYFFVFFCDILHPIAIAAILMLYYSICPEKIRCLGFFLYFFLMTYLCSILKLIYNDPRPYWADARVQALECYSEYGNPSGHSMMGVIFFGYLWRKHIYSLVDSGQLGFLSVWQAEQCQMNENLIRDPPATLPEKPKKPQKTLRFLVLSLLTLLTLFFILFGRIFLGMHSYNEVLLGLFFGFLALYMYLMYLEDYFVALLHSYIVKTAHDINEESQCVSWMLVLLTLVCYMVFLLVPIVAFEICKSRVTIPEAWYLAIRVACPGNGTFQMFYYKCFLDCGVISTGFGVLFGVLMTRGRHSVVRNDNNGFDCVNGKNMGKVLARAAVIVVVSGAFAGVCSVLPDNNDIYLSYFVNMNLGTFLSGFALIKMVPFLFSKCRIDMDGDFLKYEGGEMVLGLEEADPEVIAPKTGDVEMSQSTKEVSAAS